MKVKYNIDTDLNVDYRDSGRFRSYQLSAAGDSLEDLLEDITIAEVDQDGGELDCYGIEEASRDVQKAVYSFIEAEIVKKGQL